MAWHDVPKVPGSLSPTRHKSREGQAGLARLGSDAPMQVYKTDFLEVPEQTLTVNYDVKQTQFTKLTPEPPC